MTQINSISMQKGVKKEIFKYIDVFWPQNDNEIHALTTCLNDDNVMEKILFWYNSFTESGMIEATREYVFDEQPGDLIPVIKEQTEELPPLVSAEDYQKEE